MSFVKEKRAANWQISFLIDIPSRSRLSTCPNKLDILIIVFKNEISQISIAHTVFHTIFEIRDYI